MSLPTRQLLSENIFRMGNRKSDPAVGVRVGAALEKAFSRGLRPTDLADKLKVSRGIVTKWRQGQTPGALTLPRIAAELGYSVDFFATGRDRTQIVREVDKDVRPVPLAGEAAAGAPMATILEEHIPQFHMPEVFLREIYGTKPDAERAILLRVVGDSMEDDLPDGSLVFIDRGPGGRGFRNVNTLEAGEYRDPKVPGLILRVWENRDGTISRGWALRPSFGGRRLRIPLGKAAITDLDGARTLARQLLSGLDRGEDPRKTLGRTRSSSLTVYQACEKMVEGAEMRPTTRRDWRNILKRLKAQSIADIPAESLTDEDIDRWASKILRDSGGYSSNRAFELVRRGFSWCMEQRPRLLHTTPFVGIKAPFKREKRRERFLDEDELRRFVRALNLMPPCGHADATRLLLYTVKRRGQVEGSRRNEWNLSAAKPVWIAPSETPGSKGSADEYVALSTQAAQAARGLFKFSTGPWLLPSRGESHGEISSDFVDLLREAVDSKRPWSLHCLRATFATHAADRFRASDTLIDSILGHKPRETSEAASAYLFGRRIEEKRELLQAYADWLDELAAEVTPREMMSVRQVSAFLGLSEGRLGDYRANGIGAKPTTILKKVWYLRADVEAWKSMRDGGESGPYVAQAGEAQ